MENGKQNYKLNITGRQSTIYVRESSIAENTNNSTQHKA